VMFILSWPSIVDIIGIIASFFTQWQDILMSKQSHKKESNEVVKKSTVVVTYA
jgi:hypothetical protein